MESSLWARESTWIIVHSFSICTRKKEGSWVTAPTDTAPSLNPSRLVTHAKNESTALALPCRQAGQQQPGLAWFNTCQGYHCSEDIFCSATHCKICKDPTVAYTWHPWQGGFTKDSSEKLLGNSVLSSQPLSGDDLFSWCNAAARCPCSKVLCVQVFE